MSLSNSLASVIDNDQVIADMREYAQQKRRCEEENGVLRSIVKRCKSHGTDVKAMISVVAMSKLDPEEVRRDLRTQVHYMALRNMPVTQVDLFGGMDLDLTSKTMGQDQDWVADEAGYRAGRSGARIDDAPYPPGTELHVRWSRSWKDGQAAIAREMGENAQVAPTSRARPLRKAEADGETETETRTTESDDSTPAKRPRGRPRKTNGSAPSLAAA